VPTGENLSPTKLGENAVFKTNFKALEKSNTIKQNNLNNKLNKANSEKKGITFGSMPS
jgi:hypothetical protein